eukprot:scaffold13609_cov106-Isochrysis_galbana.AAC.6
MLARATHAAVPLLQPPRPRRHDKPLAPPRLLRSPIRALARCARSAPWLTLRELPPPRDVPRSSTRGR